MNAGIVMVHDGKVFSLYWDRADRPEGSRAEYIATFDTEAEALAAIKLLAMPAVSSA